MSCQKFVCNCSFSCRVSRLVKLATNLFIDSLLSIEIGFFSRIGECLSRLFFKGCRGGSGFFEDFFD